jgi:hypothetical protein
MSLAAKPRRPPGEFVICTQAVTPAKSTLSPSLIVASNTSITTSAPPNAGNYLPDNNKRSAAVG